MNNTYERLLSNLNAAKLEIKERNDHTLDSCIKHIKDAIFDAGRLYSKLVTLEGMVAYRKTADDFIDWDGD